MEEVEYVAIDPGEVRKAVWDRDLRFVHVASHLGVSRQRMESWLNGTVKSIPRETAEKLYAYIGLDAPLTPMSSPTSRKGGKKAHYGK